MESQMALPTALPSTKLQLPRSHLSRAEEGLRGINGAQKIISQLTAQRSAVIRLTLNYNPLGNDGISHLFNYLCSTPGSRHRITLTEINLNRTVLGCRGLQAISDYIRGNEVLKSIWLAGNVLLPEPAVLSSLASAINDSRLRLLSLTGNNELGDTFVEYFLPFLRSRHLRELHISTIGLTTLSAQAIGAWISGNPQRIGGGACHLQVLKSSGNNFGANGVWEIVRAIERGNWSITKVEMYASQLSPPLDLPETETLNMMQDAERALHRVLMRNGYLKRQTEKEAFLLLRYSRPLFMCPKSSSMIASPSRSTSPPLRTATSLFPFYALPNELKLHVLGLLTPSLSPAQRLRIYNYASDPSTLPCLLPPLRRDLGRDSFADSPSILGSSARSQVSVPSISQRFTDGKYVKPDHNPLSRREEERAKFLEAMGCLAYEPERGGQD